MNLWRKLFGPSKAEVAFAELAERADREAAERAAAAEREELARLEAEKHPRASISYVDGKMTVDSYNTKFVEDLRVKLGDVTDGKTDQEVVQAYVDRENLEREEPRLEVLHMGIGEDGQIKMQLDWNRSFIRLLKENGIEAETEDAAIEQYLSMLASSQTEFHEEMAQNAFQEIDQELQREFDEAQAQVQQKKRKPRRRNVNRSDIPK